MRKIHCINAISKYGTDQFTQVFWSAAHPFMKCSFLTPCLLLHVQVQV